MGLWHCQEFVNEEIIINKLPHQLTECYLDNFGVFYSVIARPDKHGEGHALQ